MATPKKPENAGCADSRRIRRNSITSVATPSAAPIAGSKPKRLLANTKVSTGSDE